MKKLVLTFDTNAPGTFNTNAPGIKSAQVEAPINDLSRIEITNPSGSMERFNLALTGVVSAELVEDGDA